MVPKATKGYFLNTYLVILQGSLSNGKFKGFVFIAVYHYSIPLYSPHSGWFVSLYHYSRKISFLHLPSHPKKVSENSVSLYYYIILLYSIIILYQLYIPFNMLLYGIYYPHPRNISLPNGMCVSIYIIYTYSGVKLKQYIQYIYICVFYIVYHYIQYVYIYIHHSIEVV